MGSTKVDSPIKRRGAYQQVPHNWAAPPPGTGTVPVCTQCGIRKSRAGGEDASCSGKPKPVYPTTHDYNPID